MEIIIRNTKTRVETPCFCYFTNRAAIENKTIPNITNMARIAQTIFMILLCFLFSNILWIILANFGALASV